MLDTNDYTPPLWLLNWRQILEITWFPMIASDWTNQEWYEPCTLEPYFWGKRIIDVWAWCSPLMDMIKSIWNPKSVIKIDPIYSWWDTINKHIKYNRDTIDNSWDQLRKMIKNKGIIHIEANPLTIEWINIMKQQTLDMKQHQFSTVTKNASDWTNINLENNSQDIIFITACLLFAEDWISMLQECDRLLDNKWTIIIVDYDGNIHINYNHFRDEHINIRNAWKFNNKPVFVAKLMKWQYNLLRNVEAFGFPSLQKMMRNPRTVTKLDIKRNRLNWLNESLVNSLKIKWKLDSFMKERGESIRFALLSWSFSAVSC